MSLSWSNSTYDQVPLECDGMVSLLQNLEDLDLLPAEEGDLSSLATANILSSDASPAEPDFFLPLSLPAIPPVSTGQSAGMPLLEQLDWLPFEPMSEHVPAPPRFPLQQPQPQSSLRPSLSLLEATVQQVGHLCTAWILSYASNASSA